VNYLHISGLEEGRYELWLKKEGVRLNFIIFSGKHWDKSPDFLISQRGLVKRQQLSLDLLTIDSIYLQDQNGAKVSIGGDYQNARVHAIAFNFLPPDIQGQLLKRLQRGIKPESGLFR
jgi:hypothetical protein